MFKKVPGGPAIVVCNTCRHDREARTAPNGRRGGENLFAALRAAQEGDPRFAHIEVQEMPCLFACSDFCTVHIRAEGKIGYVLGRFRATAEDAAAILEYVLHYAESTHGQVPFGRWPEGVKGHFITRMPPAGYVVE